MMNAVSALRNAPYLDVLRIGIEFEDLLFLYYLHFSLFISLLQPQRMDENLNYVGFKDVAWLQVGTLARIHPVPRRGSLWSGLVWCGVVRLVWTDGIFRPWSAPETDVLTHMLILVVLLSTSTNLRDPSILILIAPTIDVRPRNGERTGVLCPVPVL